MFEGYNNGLFNDKELFNAVENYGRKGEDIFYREYSCEDFETLSEIKRQRANFKGNNHNNQRERDGKGSNREIKFSFIDSDGNTLTEQQVY